MRLSEIYNGKNAPVFSFEVFPPKGENPDKKMENLFCELKTLAKQKPALISVTYGAGGSNRDTSLEIIKELNNCLKQPVMPHFTCVCSSREYIKKYIEEIESLGILNILALRGDEPQDIDVCYRDFKSALELIEYLKNFSELEFSVAAYPEKHPKAQSLEDDIDVLKKKCDLGAKVAFTQLFFKNENYYKFFDKCIKKGIDIPIIPGILPVASFSQLSRIVELSGTQIETKTVEYFEKYKDSKEDTIKAGIDFASEQCQKLLEFGAEGIHFYTLNKALSSCEVIKNITS